jgi:hypothetical protein
LSITRITAGVLDELSCAPLTDLRSTDIFQVLHCNIALAASGVDSQFSAASLGGFSQPEATAAS